MNIVNVRIDERLVHGIVATFWIPKLKIDRVICIDNKSAEEPMIKSALRMATPSHVYLSIIPLEKAINNLKEGKYGNERLMIIVKTPDILLNLRDAGIVFNEIVMGNLGIIDKSEERKSITNYLSVSKNDIKNFDALHELGVSLTIQLIPDDVPSDFYELMKVKI